MDHSRLIDYIDNLKLERHKNFTSIDNIREYIMEVWEYRNEMDPGQFILLGLSDEENEGWFEENVFTVYREDIDRENHIKLANDFDNHHSLLAKYGVYAFYSYDSIKKYVLYIYVDGLKYEISEQNPTIEIIQD